MIEDLIKKEMITFLDQEVIRIKKNETYHKDPDFAKVGININYLDQVENLLSNKNITKAKQLLAELDEKIKAIKDEVIKNKVYIVRTEVRNAIEVSEKVETAKKDLELKLKGVKTTEKKSFFSEQDNKPIIKKMMDEGIKNKPTDNKQSFFTAVPDKLTVVQNIMTPDQPMPSSKPQNNSPAEPTEKVMQQTIMPVPTPMPAIKNYEEEFSKINFVLNELHALLEEKDLKEARNEYGRARGILESLPETDRKHNLSDELFKAYHEIKLLEQEDEANKTKEAKHHEEIKEKGEMHRMEEFIKLKEKQVEKNIPQNIDTVDVQQKILEAKHESIKQGKIPKEIHEAQQELNDIQNLQPKLRENKSIEKIKPFIEKKTELPISLDMDIDEPNIEELERKEKKLMNEIHHDHPMEQPIIKPEIIETIHKAPINKKVMTNIPIGESEGEDLDLMYNEGVSLLYNGNISKAQSLFEQIIKQKPYHMAARIRLKECKHAN